MYCRFAEKTIKYARSSAFLRDSPQYSAAKIFSKIPLLKAWLFVGRGKDFRHSLLCGQTVCRRQAVFFFPKREKRIQQVLIFAVFLWQKTVAFAPRLLARDSGLEEEKEDGVLFRDSSPDKGSRESRERRYRSWRFSPSGKASVLLSRLGRRRLIGAPIDRICFL